MNPVRLVLAFGMFILRPRPGLADGHEVSDREFNFTRFSNLEEITFIIGRTPGDLLWIPRALSTVKPITSPRFSVLNLMPGYELPHPIPAHYRLWLRNVTRLTEEVSRIEHEFMGTVKVTWYPEVDISPVGRIPTCS